MTTIAVSEQTKEGLRSLGRKGETYDEILQRAVEAAKNSCFLRRRRGCLRKGSSFRLTKYSVLVERGVAGALARLEPGLRSRIKKGLKRLAEDPFTKRSGCDIKQLHGSSGTVFYRLRVGDYRAVYAVKGRKIMVTVVGHRSKAYSFLD